jgi:hypothetical protein
MLSSFLRRPFSKTRSESHNWQSWQSPRLRDKVEALALRRESFFRITLNLCLFLFYESRCWPRERP